VTRPDEPQRPRRSNAAPGRSPAGARPAPTSRRSAKPASAKPGSVKRTPAQRTSAKSAKPVPFAAPVRPRGRRSKRPYAFRLGSQTRRLRASFLVVAFIMSIFAGRLIQLQGVDANSYASLARDARMRTVVLPAARGDITDTNGVELATTVDTLAITADPKQTAPNAAQIAGILAPRLGLDAATITKALTAPKKRFVYVARQVDQSVWKKIRADLATAHLAGISTESDPKRIYPAGSVAANMIGFVGTNVKNMPAGLGGLTGLESSLNSILAGKNGQQTYEVSSEGPALPLGDDSLQKPVAGQGVQLTIDADLQYIAQKAITDAVKKTGADSGDAVVIDVQTGQVLAMATAPTYDANKPFAGGYTAKTLPRDRPVTDTYEPGSVFKLFTAAALLDQGLVTPKTKEMVPGYLYRDGSRIKDWWGHGTVPLTFAGAIAKSSNIGTILAAEQMTPQTQADYLAKFGIGQPLDVGLPDEATHPLPGGSSWSPLTKATISFGQGVAVNALQMAVGVAAIANGGERIAPQLVKGYVAPDGTVTPAPAPARTRVISPTASRQLLDIMEQVTKPDGIAPKGAIAGYRTGGKTGTAQKANSACGCYKNYTVSFAQVAPADSPRFVAYVDLQNVDGHASGGGNAGPISAQILKATLQKYHVPPSGSVAPNLKLDWNINKP
jgi:cell division protein FtsI (penicillin-binding protein 3)